jgi:alpha-1,2-mannosyltransferase
MVILLAAALAYAPVIGELIIGNVHLLILGLLAGAWLALSRGTPRGEIAAGLLVGIATLVKVFPGVLILWFLLTGRLRAAAAAGIVMAALVAITLPLTGLGPWLDYPTVLELGPPDPLGARPYGLAVRVVPRPRRVGW